MKVKIFNEHDEPRNKYGYCKVPLEKRINDFIKDKKVIDIKYQANVSGYANESCHGDDKLERALVMYEEKIKIKNRIKELREKENVSQGDVAKALNVTPQAINQYETGMHEPTLEMWDRLAIYFNVPVAYLQGYTVYLYGNNKKYEYRPDCMNKCFEKSNLQK